MSQEPMPVQRQVARRLPEWGDAEVIALVAENAVYFPLKMLCFVFLGHVNDRAQRARVHRDPILRQLTRTLQVETPGGPQQMVCLERLGIGRWINGIDVNRMRPELRERFLAFQWDLTRLADHLLFSETDTDMAHDLGSASVGMRATHPSSHVDGAQLAALLDYLARRVGTLELDMRQLKQWQVALITGDDRQRSLPLPETATDEAASARPASPTDDVTCDRAGAE